MVAPTRVSTAEMTSSQRRVFDELLAIGTDRPFSPDGLTDQLRHIITTGTADALGRWTEPSLWLSKSTLSTVLRCEGQTLAYAQATPSSEMAARTVVGIVAHRAIQVSYTHPDLPIRSYVDWAIEAARADDAAVELFWSQASPAIQSDVISQAVERVSGFLDSWPTLKESWEPRFEASIQAKIGKLTLAGRADLLLGRPRPPRQTMFLCDIKTGALHDGHAFEAAFYALISTLRHGVAPFRSVVYSVSSGEWVGETPDAEMLIATAEQVVSAVNAYVDVLCEARPPVLTPGPACSWCPARATCPAAAMLDNVSGVRVAATTATPIEAVSAGDPDASTETASDPTPPPTSAGTPASSGPHGPFTL